MNRFYLMPTSEKDRGLKTTGEIHDYLKARGCQCVVREYQGQEELPEGTECILVLGGDGTMIQAARDTVDRKIPLLGINLGTLGFLAEIERSGIPDALDSLLLDNYTIEPRMLLEGQVCREDGEPVKNIALNDIVVNRAGALRIIDYEISVNGEFLNRYSADGIIAKEQLDILKNTAYIIELPDGNFELIGDNYKPRPSSSASTLQHYYDILGISPAAGNNEIKARWKELIITWHPDHAQSQGASAEEIEQCTIKMAEINNAYQYIMKTRKI